MNSYNSIAATAFHPVRWSIKNHARRGVAYRFVALEAAFLPYRSDLVTLQTPMAVRPEARRPTTVLGSFDVRFWHDGEIGLEFVLVPWFFLVLVLTTDRPTERRSLQRLRIASSTLGSVVGFQYLVRVGLC